MSSASDESEPVREPTPDPGSGLVEPEVVDRSGPPQPSLAATTTSAWAWLVLTLLVAIHTLIEADIWLMASHLPDVRQELSLEETDAAWLSTVLLVAAALAAPIAGYLADWMRRPRLMAIATGVWGLAVVGTGLSRSFDHLQLARAAAGAGGAAATVTGLTLLVDVFPRRMRGRALAAFFLAMPAGALLAMGIRVAIPAQAGWPAAFLAAGAPGLALALLALVLPHPVRGASEPVDLRRLRLHEYVGASQDDYVDLMVNSSFNYSLFGLAFSAFAVAGLAFWLPAFLTAKGMEPGQAGRLSIAILLAAAAAGTAVGGWLTDTFAATRPGACSCCQASRSSRRSLACSRSSMPGRSSWSTPGSSLPNTPCSWSSFRVSRSSPA